MATFSVRTPNGEVELRTPAHAQEWYDQHHLEWPLQRDLAEELEPNAVFYDVGSQFGFYLKFAQQCGVRKRQIVGFERHRERFHRLERHTPRGLKVVFEEVGDGEGGSLSLDEFRGKNPLPDIIKIDVEGGEAAVIDGMQDLLDHGVLLYIETHPEFLREQGRTVDQIIEPLLEHGYALQAVAHRDSEDEFEPYEESLNDNIWLLKADPS
jgi:hypothetical protein